MLLVRSVLEYGVVSCILVSFNLLFLAAGRDAMAYCPVFVHAVLFLEIQEPLPFEVAR